MSGNAREKAKADSFRAWVRSLLAQGLSAAKNRQDDRQVLRAHCANHRAGTRGSEDMSITLRELVRTAPERIWLQISDDADHWDEPFPYESEVTWCQDSVQEVEVGYVRADTIATMEQKIAELEAKLACEVEAHAQLQSRCFDNGQPTHGSVFDRAAAQQPAAAVTDELPIDDPNTRAFVARIKALEGENATLREARTQLAEALRLSERPEELFVQHGAAGRLSPIENAALCEAFQTAQDARIPALRAALEAARS